MLYHAPKRLKPPKCPKCGGIDVGFAKQHGQYKQPIQLMWECNYCWHRWPL